MTNTRNRVVAAVSSRLRDVRSRYGALLITMLLLALGVLVVLLVQPAPQTFAEGWSSPQVIEQVRLGKLHRAVMDSQDNIHLVWLKQVGRKLVAFYARLDQYGQLIVDPIPLSDPDANAEDAALALTSDDAPLAYWIEKAGEDVPQRLMMARPGTGEPPQVISASPRILRDLAVATDEQGSIFLVWSDNREGLYDIYMTAFDSRGNLTLNERRVTNSGKAFVYDPVLAAAGGTVHLIYFSDQVVREYLMYEALTTTGEALAEPQVLEQVEQMAQQLGGENTQLDFQLTAVAEIDGQLHLYESLGPLVRLRKIDQDAQTVPPSEPLLMGSRYYSQVNVVRGEEGEWLVWADTRQRDQERFQVYAAPLDDAGALEEETRLTYSLSSALWPVMLLDSGGGRHLIWQQAAGPYTYELMYINDLEPARISVWQRLGFTGDDGGLSFLVAVVQSAVFAVITTVLNVWRLAIAWAVTALAYLVLRRIDAVRPYIKIITWCVLLLTLFVIARPETETLGQMPVAIADAAHWAMCAVASAIVLYLGWVWREEFHGVLIWAGVVGLWLWLYYFLNLTLILREGFAV